MAETDNHIQKIAIAGLGTVGAGLISLINAHQENLRKKSQPLLPIEIVAVSARDKNKKRGIDISPYQWFDEPTQMAQQDDIDIVIELMGGEYGAAEDTIKTAITNGKSVVTANKALLARNGFEIAQLVEKNQVMLGWEAAVAGVIPVISSISNHLVADNIQSMYGILNGTSNYILTKMQREKIDFADALKDAQQLGLAEADPALDISGMDAAQKLALLASIGFQIKPDVENIYVEGIDKIQYADIEFAESLGYRIKLIAHGEKINGKIYLNVSPILLPIESTLAHIDNEMNAIAINSQYAGAGMLTGAGAGGYPTAVAVFSDIINMIRHPNHSNCPFVVETQHLQEADYFPHDDYEAQYFVRIRVKDIPGVLADVMGVMKEYGASIDMFMQRNVEQRREADSVSLMMITHRTRHAVIQATMEKIKQLPFVLDNLLAIKLAKSLS